MNLLQYYTHLDDFAVTEADFVDFDSYNLSKQSDFSVFHINVRSINKNFDELLILLESLKDKFDIIILTETWKIHCLDNYKIINYNMFYSEGNFNQNDGVLVFVRADIRVEMVSKSKLHENTFLILNLSVFDLTCQLIAVYRLPSTDVGIFLSDLRDILTQRSKESLCIFTGDINLDLLNKNDLLVNEYLNIMAENGFLSYINKTTRATNTSESCLDHIFICSPAVGKIKLESFILKSDITDHYPIILKSYFLTKHTDPFLEKASRSCYKINIDYKKLKEGLKRESWNEIMTMTDPNESYICFINTLLNLIKQFSTKTKIPSYKHKIKPWITVGLINSIRTRDKLKRKVLKDKKNINLLIQYKRYRNSLKTLIQKTKRDYFINKLDENKNNPKKLWSAINEELNKTKTVEPIVLKNHNDETISDKRIIADMFNNFFINVGEKMASKINVQKILPERNLQCTNMFLYPVLETEIIKNIDKLKNNAAPGLDQVSSITIKKIKSEIVKPLAYIFNLCFSVGVFPSDLKKSVVTPIYKNNDKYRMDNYRPISVINNFGKLLEMSLRERLNGHITKNNILSNNQFGFREKVSTENALFQVSNTINNALNSNKKPLVIFLDLAKAFDTVSHKILLERLNNYGIRGLPNKIFESYLDGREQCVKIDGEFGNFQFVNCGIPQGTVLGPILFSLYINELLFIQSNAKIVSYADDTVLLFTGRTWKEVFEMASIEFSTIVQWFGENLLTLNMTKTRFMCFSIYDIYQPDHGELKIHSFDCIQNNKQNCQCTITLNKIDKIKYLGVIMDKNMKWEEHIQQLNAKIRKLIWKFYNIRNVMPTKILRTLYITLAESIIRYGISIWGGTFPSNMNMLNITQKFLLKVLLHKQKRYPSDLLFAEANVFNIPQLYIKSVILFTYKNSELRNSVFAYNTRSNARHDLNVPRLTKTTTQRFLPYFASKFYNILPIEIRSINSISLFSKKICRIIKTKEPEFLRVLKLC